MEVKQEIPNVEGGELSSFVPYEEDLVPLATTEEEVIIMVYNRNQLERSLNI